MKNNKEAFRDYLAYEKKYSIHTVNAYCKDLDSFENFLHENNPGMVLEEVDYSLVRQWIVLLSNSEVANKTINRKIASLKSFYRFLLKVKQISVSPVAKHKSLKVDKKVQIPFSEYELKAVMDLFEDEGNFDEIRNRLIVELLYSTGMRRAELLGLQCKDLFLERGYVKVVGKRKKERLIPLLPVVIKRIEQYLLKRADIESIADNSYLFLKKNGLKISESFVYRLINSYFSDVSKKVKKSPHVLRHSFATHLLNNGADINSVKELLGHSSLASTQVYTNSSISELKKVYVRAHPRNSQ